MGASEQVIEDDRYEHHMTGVIHEVAPRQATAEAFHAAISHERDGCRAHSVVVDLRHVGDAMGDAEVDVLVSHVEPDIHRWAVRVPEHPSVDLIARLRAAGLEPVLIQGEGPSAPRAPRE